MTCKLLREDGAWKVDPDESPTAIAATAKPSTYRPSGEPGWVADASSASLPSFALKGNLGGTAFLAKSATLALGVLTINGERFPDGLTLFLFDDAANGDVAGKTFLFNPSAKFGSVHAHMSYTDLEGKSHNEAWVQSFTLQLRFGREAGKPGQLGFGSRRSALSGYVYWCGPDPAHSFMAGKIAIRESR